MKKNTRTITNVCLGVFLALPGLIAAPAMAEVIEWNGDPDELTTVTYEDPDWGPTTLSDTLVPPSESSSNTVTANNGQAGNIIGGFSQTIDANRNTVMVNTGVEVSDTVYGGFSVAGNANNNSVTADFGTVCCGVTGGNSISGDASNNSVTVNTSSDISDVYGGRSKFQESDSVAGSMGHTDNNTVRLTVNSAVDGVGVGTINGGEVNFGTANNNRVDLSVTLGNDSQLYQVFGGKSEGAGSTNRNSVSVSVSGENNLTIAMISGGESANEANDNVVTVFASGDEDLNISSLTGGQSGSDGSANYNSLDVTVSGGDELYITTLKGGQSVNGDANGNTVNLSMTGGEGLYLNAIRGGEASEAVGDASNNTVSVFQSGSERLTINDIYGGASYESGNTNNNSVIVTQISDVQCDAVCNNVSHVRGGISAGEANHNSVQIETSGSAFDIYGGDGQQGASNNSVYVKADLGGGYIFGGHTYDGDGDEIAGDASNNVVTVILGAVGDYTGDVTGGYADFGNADGNTVIARDSFVTGDVIGGQSLYKSADGNIVTVRNSYIDGNIYGGRSEGETGLETAHNNTVTLEGATNITGGVYGGFTYEDNVDVYSGNTLNVWNYTGTTQTELIANFENYNFIVPASITNGGTVISTASIDYGTSATITGLELAAGAPVFRVGDHIVLIQADAHEPGNTVATQQVSGSDGAFMAYDWSVGQEDSNLVARLLGQGVDQDRARPLSQTRLAGLAFLADNDLEIERPAKPGLTPFLLTKGGWMRHNTGSHIDINGFHMMGGVSWNDQVEFGKVMVAAFLEGGWGDFDTSTSAHSGDGETSYFGGGLMGRIDFADTGPGNFYTEASFRGGHASIDLNGSDLFDSFGQQATFETDSFYLKAHAGLGYIWSVNEVSSFDFYGKYTWTHLGSDDVTVMGSSVNFDSMDSHRIRIGTRYKQDVVLANDMVLKPYVGAAFEHEFDAESEGSINGYRMDNVDLTGSSMMSEIGLSFSPSVESNLHVELGVQGFLGQREGIDGQFRIKYTF